MTKKQMTRRERMRSMIAEAEPGSILHTELVTVRDILSKPKEKALPQLLRFLKPSLHPETKWMIGWTLETVKDERIIRPMIRALQAPENANRSNYFL